MQTLGIDQLVGRLLGEYQIEQLLGRGELSTVYIAHQPAHDQKVMVIVFNPPEGISAQEHQRFTLRFAQEGASLVRLKHPNILPTYDFGELSGRPYLVTALVKGVSLKQLLRQQGRFTLQQTLDILKQMASALDYAHSNGIVHGLLNISNILIDQDSTVQVINFGTRAVSDSQRRMQNEQPIDAHADIYALGTILYELLSGTPPFDGASLSNVPSMRFLQSVPSIHARCPDLPEALDLVMDKALEQNPVKGYQQAGDIVFAFERVLKAVNAISDVKEDDARQLFQNAQVTLPPTVNWFDEASIFPDKSERGGEWGVASSEEHIPTVISPRAVPSSAPPVGDSSGARRVDTLKLWSVTEVGPDTQRPLTGKLKPASVSPGTFPPYARRPVQQDRRKVLALIAAGTVGVTAFALGGMSLIQHMQQSSTQVANGPGNTNNTVNNASSNGTTPNAQSTQGPKSTATAASTPTAQPTPTQVAQAQPTTPPATHTGTVIGYTNQANNTAKSFTNPADGKNAVLIHLSNGNFVAGETACPHEGALVTYNASTQKLDCTRHSAIFDPANGFSYVPGSFSGQLGSLRTVTIRVNGDGTITTG